MNKIIIAIYGCVWVLFCVLTYLFVDPNIPYLSFLYSGFYSTNRIVVTILFALIICIQFFIYTYFIHSQMDRYQLKVIAIISIGFLLLSYPAMLSADIFNYITNAKLLSHYGENPYIVMPIEIIGEPYLSFTHFANTTTIYGPIWTALSGLTYFLGFNTFIGHILAFKLISALSLIMIASLIWVITSSIKNVLFFVLNPLVLIELVASGHNDGVMMGFALLSFLLIQKKRYLLAGLSIFLSIGIKYATIVLVPIILYAIVQSIRGKKVAYTRLYFLSFLSMFVVFGLSFLRVEIYPWYAIWILSFASLLRWNRLVHGALMALSLGLLLRYIPFMLTGSHIGISPLLRSILLVSPFIIWFIYGILVRTITVRSIREAFGSMLELKHK